jgi:hypothetical protein
MVSIGDMAPNLSVSEWVQGNPTNLDAHRGKAILVEVFQVNCPGCFLYGLPEAIEVSVKHRNEDLTVIGLATAFEDFDKNNLENLQKLIQTGEVVGETLRALEEHEWLEGKTLRYKIPFPVAMDRLVPGQILNIEKKVEAIIKTEIPNFERISYGEQARITKRIQDYLLQREIVPETFESYDMKGTPTSLLIDKNGILRYKIFGQPGKLEKSVREILAE